MHTSPLQSLQRQTQLVDTEPHLQPFLPSPCTHSVRQAALLITHTAPASLQIPFALPKCVQEQKTFFTPLCLTRCRVQAERKAIYLSILF